LGVRAPRIVTYGGDFVEIDRYGLAMRDMWDIRTQDGSGEAL